MVTIVLPIIQVREWPLASINFTALVLKMKQNVLLHLLYQMYKRSFLPN